MNVHTKITFKGRPIAPAEGVDRSDATATNSAANRAYYKSRVPIYPKLVHGDFRKVKWIVMTITLAIYYLTPWLRWDRGPGAPNQAVLVDLAHERFYFFFIEIWPQEVYYITGLLILASLGIFLAAALFGRVWCGYACQQTVWTDLFIYVENLIEGDRAARIRLAAAPWTAQKISKRVAKHAIWILIAMATGGAWVFYFADAPGLARDLLAGRAGLAAYGGIALLTFTTYSLGGLMREQVCTYMCPWPRIQAALGDNDTLNVTYRRDRGEPRGPYRKGESWNARGSCIDCNQCVAACPMGIDIRDGAQLECINCALCIDACDDVMDRIGQPRGLIAYDTEANALRRLAHETPHHRFVRPRTILYGSLFAIVGLLMLYGLATRATLGLDVLRDRNPNFVTLADGSVRNGYTLKLLNHANRARAFELSVSGIAPAKVVIIGLEGIRLPASIAVEPDRVRTLRVLLTLAPERPNAARGEFSFVLRDPATKETASTPSLFVSAP
jgi:cytochrome c oxidase accessory protein FixG